MEVIKQKRLVGLQKIYAGEIAFDVDKLPPSKKLLKPIVNREALNIFTGDDFAMLSGLFSLLELRKSQSFQVFKFAESQYAGETHSGKRQG